MALTLPPDYSPSPPAPSYSFQPSPSERRLEHSLRRHQSPLPAGTFTKAARGVSIILDQQDPAPSAPTYGRNAPVAGAVYIDDPARITAVAVQLDGTLDLRISEGGSRSTRLLHTRRTLWEGTVCPPVLAFALPLPATFTDRDRDRPLPPSFSVSFPRIPILCASVTYSLTVTVTSARTGVAFWPRHVRVSVPLEYAPRTRPHRPILVHTPLFASLKPAPEEWHQVISTMETRSTSGLAPITAHLFLPSVRIFALGDTIPFHVQLAGPPASLAALAPAAVRVFLLRQVAVTVRAQRAFRNAPLGEGKLVPLPPCADADADGRATLDWEGEVRCRADTATGGFNAGALVVKDFLVLELKPPDTAASPLLEMQCAHPIRLVSDPWIETGAV